MGQSRGVSITFGGRSLIGRAARELGHVRYAPKAEASSLQ